MSLSRQMNPSETRKANPLRPLHPALFSVPKLALGDVKKCRDCSYTCPCRCCPRIVTSSQQKKKSVNLWTLKPKANNLRYFARRITWEEILYAVSFERVLLVLRFSDEISHSFQRSTSDVGLWAGPVVQQGFLEHRTDPAVICLHFKDGREQVLYYSRIFRRRWWLPLWLL